MINENDYVIFYQQNILFVKKNNCLNLILLKNYCFKKLIKIQVNVVFLCNQCLQLHYNNI